MGYIAFYNGKRIEVNADSLYAAKVDAIRVFKVPKSKQHMVSVLLCESGDKQVIHSTASL